MNLIKLTNYITFIGNCVESPTIWARLGLGLGLMLGLGYTITGKWIYLVSFIKFTDIVLEIMHNNRLISIIPDYAHLP